MLHDNMHIGLVELTTSAPIVVHTVSIYNFWLSTVVDDLN